MASRLPGRAVDRRPRLNETRPHSGISSNSWSAWVEKGVSNLFRGQGLLRWLRLASDGEYRLGSRTVWAGIRAKRRARVPAHLHKKTGDNKGTGRTYPSRLILGGCRLVSGRRRAGWLPLQFLQALSLTFALSLVPNLCKSLFLSLDALLSEPTLLSPFSTTYIAAAGHLPYSIEFLAPAYRP